MPTTRQKRKADDDALLPGIPMDEKRPKSSKGAASSSGRASKPAAKKGKKVLHSLVPCVMAYHLQMIL